MIMEVAWKRVKLMQHVLSKCSDNNYNHRVSHNNAHTNNNTHTGRCTGPGEKKAIAQATLRQICGTPGG